MGIKLKSEDEVWDRVASSGARAVGTDYDTMVAPFSGSVKAVVAIIGTATASGAADVLNLKKNQANMFANATPFSFAAAGTTVAYDATDFAAGTVISVTKGDKISLDIGAVGTTPGKGAAVYVLFTRRPNVAITAGSFNPEDTRP